jgi:DNA repair protein RadC
MSMSRCRPGTLRHASLPVRGPLDALDVFTAFRTRPERSETMAIVLDHAHRNGSLVMVEGASSAEAASVLTERITAAFVEDHRFGALVLASVRPNGLFGPSDEDHFAFAPLRAVGEDGGVEVLDWFVMSGQRSWSMAELTDAVPLWRGTRQRPT